MDEIQEETAEEIKLADAERIVILYGQYKNIYTSLREVSNQSQYVYFTKDYGKDSATEHYGEYAALLDEARLAVAKLMDKCGDIKKTVETREV